MYIEHMNAIVINPDKTVTETELSDLKSMQDAVGGYIEAVNLTFGTLWVNEEFRLGQFGPEDFNSIGSDLCGLGGRPDLMLGGILGPVFLTGGPDGTGETLDVTVAGRNAVKRIAREA